MTSYRFSAFELRPATRQLLRDGAPLRLGARAFDLLLCLVERADRVVDKHELMANVWRGRVVGDNNLNVQVSTLRRLLGPQGVVTVPGRGLRFGLALGADAPASADATILPDKASIAVLPFLDLGAGAGRAWLADSLCEDITTELSRFHSLFVVARNSAFTYRGQAVDVRLVSRQLGVRYVLEGSVRQDGQRLRVVVQLISALSGEHLWAERYDRRVDDLFEVEDGITQAVVAAIAPQIGLAEDQRARRLGPAAPGAHGFAQRAWALASAHDLSYDPVPRDEAVRLATQALALDADCALALRTIAAAKGWHAFHGTAGTGTVAVTEGLAAVARAIELDRHDHHAWRLAGMLHLMAGRRAAGEAALRRAHETNAHCALTLSWLGFCEATQGAAARGVASILAALRLSPHDPSRGAFLVLLGLAQFAGGRYGEAVQASLDAMQEAPGAAVPQVVAAIGWVGLDRIDRARTTFEALQAAAPGLVAARLDGQWLAAATGFQRRAHLFFRIAAGLEDPALSRALRTRRACGAAVPRRR